MWKSDAEEFSVAFMFDDVVIYEKRGQLRCWLVIVVIEKDGVSFRGIEKKGVFEAPLVHNFQVCVHVIM